MAFWNKQPPVEDFSGRIGHVAFIMDGNVVGQKREQCLVNLVINSVQTSFVR